jgi:predicted nuclease of restriction endonuclease-like (RecB) superfamily
MVKFAREFPDEQIVVSLIPQLSWTHILALLSVKSPEARVLYAQQASERHLSVQELRGIVDRKAFERREIANSQVTERSAVPLDSFRDPYLLDFLGLEGAYQERDLEEAIIRELEPFLLEAGKGWTEKRMVIDSDDRYVDLLFFSRPLRRFVAAELRSCSRCIGTASSSPSIGPISCPRRNSKTDSEQSCETLASAWPAGRCPLDQRTPMGASPPVSQTKAMRRSASSGWPRGYVGTSRYSAM